MFFPYGTKHQILVVDDSRTMRSLITSILDDEKIDYLEADNGQKALELANDNRISLLITDIHMPMMDGLTLIQKIRKMARYRFLKIIVLSSDDEKIKEISKSAGATGWFKKPVDQNKLINYLRSS